MIYLRADGRTVGPFDEAELRGRVAAGELPLATMSWCEGEDTWVTLARRWRVPENRAAPLAAIAGIAGTATAFFWLEPWMYAAPLPLQRAGVSAAACAALVLPAIACSVGYWRHTARRGKPTFLAVASTIAALLLGLGAAGQALILGTILENRRATENGSIWYEPSLDALVIDGGLGVSLVPDLERELARLPDLGLVLIDSGGGLLDDAITAGRLLAERNLTVRVDGECASACVALWSAVPDREMTEDSWLGLHRTSSEGNLPASWLRAWTAEGDARQAALMREAGFSARLLAAQRETPPEEMHWISAREAADEGVRFRLVAAEDDGGPAEAAIDR